MNLFPLLSPYVAYGGYGIQPPQPSPLNYDPRAARKQAWRDAALVAGQGLTSAAFGGGWGDIGSAISQGIGAFRGSQEQALQAALAQQAAQDKANQQGFSNQLAAANYNRSLASDVAQQQYRQGQLGIEQQKLDAAEAEKERQRAALAQVLGYLPPQEQPKMQAALDSGIKGATDQVFKLLYPEPEKPDVPREPKRGFIKGPDGRTYMFGLTPVKDDDHGDSEASKAALTQSSYIAAYDRRLNARLEDLKSLREAQYRASGAKVSPEQRQKDAATDRASAEMWAREQMKSVSRAWGEDFGRGTSAHPEPDPEPDGDADDAKGSGFPEVLAGAAQNFANQYGIPLEQARALMLDGLRSKKETIQSILKRYGGR